MLKCRHSQCLILKINNIFKKFQRKLRYDSFHFCKVIWKHYNYKKKKKHLQLTDTLLKVEKLNFKSNKGTLHKVLLKH